VPTPIRASPGAILLRARQRLRRWRIRNRDISVVFRYDDYSARSSTEIELRILDTLRLHEASVTFSVIPFLCAGDVHDPSPQSTVALPAEKQNILKQAVSAGILDVALHGYSHQTARTGDMAEFAGLPGHVQAEKLAAGKKYVEELTGVPVTTFVPPWNRYDLDTLRALETQGFSTLSAGKEGLAAPDCPLSFVPATCGLLDLPKAIDAARDVPQRDPLIVALFHDYDFREVNGERGIITSQGFADLVGRVARAKRVTLVSIAAATRRVKDLQSGRLLAWKNTDSLVY
jgi:peptidoglycan/xylan/chitin deacetylase (PgdA/CDA1 family)